MMPKGRNTEVALAKGRATDTLRVGSIVWYDHGAFHKQVVPVMPKHNPHLDDETLVEEEQQALKPPLYKVLMHNDDFTTMDFVVFVLMEVFHKDYPEAETIMYAVHRKGLGVAGVFTREIAETKINQVYNLARAHEFPLLCTMEEE
jgi:ATP-dependent Clp protease adaptor protein ClpS